MQQQILPQTKVASLVKENAGTRVSHLITCPCGFVTRKPSGFSHHAQTCNGRKPKPKKVWDRSRGKWVVD